MLSDPYQPGASCLHRGPPTLKIIAALALVVIVAASPTGAWATYGVVGVGLLVVLLVSGVNCHHLAWRLLTLEPLAAGIPLLALFRPDGSTLCLTLMVKSNLCLLTMLLLTATTRFSEVVTVLRRLRVPALLVTTLALAYRYLFVLADEATRISRARRSRTVTEARGLAWWISATVIAGLFLRTLERAERVYMAMAARGWHR